MQVASEAHTHGNVDDAEYSAFLQRVNARFRSNTEGKPVFTTATEGLWAAYLESFPEELRQHHNCNACRHFVERFGALVTIGESTGVTRSAVWDADDAPPVYQLAVSTMRRLVERSKVTGPFLSNEATWGQPVTGQWQHLFVKNPTVFRHALLTPFQAMAEKKEDFKNMLRALDEFDSDTVKTALDLLQSEALYRAEKVLGPAKWLMDLHSAREGKHGLQRANVVWLAVATAPPGFAHPRSSMIGTLLEDIAAGKPFTEVSRAFAEKMRADAYQRPQAPPAAGTIAAAEKAFAAMGLARSLERRFARVEEIQAIWRPAAPTQPVGDGLFGHLQPKGAAPARTMNVPAQTITWDKFARTVLPDVKTMELYAPNHGNFGALLTAVHDDAPPILQWDREEQRNPFSWYVYTGGSSAANWGLRTGWVDVTAVTLKPSMWHGGNEHQGKGVFFALAGARDGRDAGNALFPETMRSELHQFRSVIEAYARSAKLGGRGEPGHACGYLLAAGSGTWNVKVRVTTAAGVREYLLDRWD